MKSVVHFAEERLKEAYNKLKDSKVEDRMLYKWISRAIDDLKINAFCGIQELKFSAAFRREILELRKKFCF